MVKYNYQCNLRCEAGAHKLAIKWLVAGWAVTEPW